MKQKQILTSTQQLFQDIFGSRNAKLLLASPYKFAVKTKIKEGKSATSVLCVINGKTCNLFFTSKAGAYSKIWVYNIAYNGEVVFQNTSLKILLDGVAAAEKLFS